MELTDAERDALRRRAGELAVLARDEDLGSRGDITSQLTIPQDDVRTFALVCRQPGILAGRLVASEILGVYDPAIDVEWSVGCTDGADILTGQQLAALTGQTRSILSAERVLLNFLQRLCGVATATRQYVDAIAGTGARIFDTRKTIPAWRILDKYAVRCGGGHNHRMGLYDAILVKDNHLGTTQPDRLARAVFDMLNQSASLDPAPLFVEVEADTLHQAEQIFKVVGIDVVLLDNFSLEELRKAVALRDSLGLAGKVELEASGGVTLDTVRDIAETGVDRISVGAITHSAPALDLALDAAP